MPFILKHQDKPNTFLSHNEETGEYKVVTSKKHASFFPTEASAIVTLEDYEGQEDFYPEYIK